MTIIKEFSDLKMWEDAIHEKIMDVVSFDSKLVIGLAGGSTPRDVYARLGREIMDPRSWEKLQFVIIDDRDVAFAEDASNYGMIRSFLPKAKILFFDREMADPSLIEKSMDRNLRLVKKENYLFDLLILGMGEDGHLASLFPGFDEQKMNNPKRLAVRTVVPGNEYPERFSLTFPALLSTKEAILLVKGEEKLKLLEDIKKGDYQLHDENEFPIVRFLREVPTTVYAYR